MLAIFNSTPIVSRDGKPVHGRFYVYQKDTNQLADVFTYNTNKDLVPGQNPIYTDNNGFPEYSVIVDNLIYSVVVEEYNGDYMDPKADTRPTMWNICNNYYVGNLPDEIIDTTVYGINGLAKADPELGHIDVVGYYSSYDCGKRTYVWDPTSVEEPDGGYVIRSDKSSVGRWKLLNDNPWIPSEWYGVYPGATTNLNNLISVPKTLGGSLPINIPSAIKFATGTYSLASNITLTNNRDIIIDNETKFDQEHSITCNGLTIMGNVVGEKNGIGKFIFPKNATAYASWFYKFDDFFTCKAGTLVIDKDSGNWYPPNNITVTGTTIEFAGRYKINVYHTAAGRLTLDNCVVKNAIKGLAGFSNNTIFENMEYSDKFCTSGGESNGNGVVAETCSINLKNFEHVNAYLELAFAREHYTSRYTKTFDLDGRSVSAVNVGDVGGCVVRLVNGHINSIECKSEIEFINCTVHELNVKYKTSSSEVIPIKFSGCNVYNMTSTCRVSVNAVNSDIDLGSAIAEFLDCTNCRIAGRWRASSTDDYDKICIGNKMDVKNCTINSVLWGYRGQGYTKIYAKNTTFNKSLNCTESEVFLYNCNYFEASDEPYNYSIDAYDITLYNCFIQGSCMYTNWWYMLNTSAYGTKRS